MSAVTISRESPVQEALAQLMARHTADMHADTPPESIHMMDASELDHPDIAFYVMRKAGIPVGMGAFSRFDGSHAEIKSMHVLIEHRGRGFSRRMLQHLMDEAKLAGVTRLSLETGFQAMFLPARMLYLKAGFEVCGPFGSYALDPNSVFMTRALA